MSLPTSLVKLSELKSNEVHQIVEELGIKLAGPISEFIYVARLAASNGNFSKIEKEFVETKHFERSMRNKNLSTTSIYRIVDGLENYLSSFLSNGLDIEIPTCKDLMSQYPDLKEIFNLLFENTKYFTTQQVKNALLKQIEIWKEKRIPKKLYVLMSPYKVGSEQYFYYIFKDILPEHELIFIDEAIDIYKDHSDIGVEILFLDDWSLSGNNMLGNIDVFISNYFPEEAKEIEYEGNWIETFHPEFNKINNPSLSLTIIVAITTEDVIKLLNEIGVTPTIYYEYLIPNFGDVLRSHNISQKLINDFSIIFNKESEIPSYPVHLEYKIANEFGSYPIIYNSCRINKPDKTFMDVASLILKR